MIRPAYIIGKNRARLYKSDAKFKKKSENKLMSLLDKNVTVLFVSHNTEQVRKLCNKAIILEKGKMIASGDVEEVAAKYDALVGK